MDSGGQGPAAVVQRLLAAINAHDLEAMVACFTDNYVNEWPAHPQRGFQGRAQVRQNWSQLFAGVPNLQARLPRMAVDGDTVWTEWDIAGTRGDGAAFLLRGVAIFGVADNRLAWVRFYLEPVEETSGDVNAHTRQVVAAPPPPLLRRRDHDPGGRRDRHARHPAGAAAGRPGPGRAGA